LALAEKSAQKAIRYSLIDFIANRFIKNENHCIDSAWKQIIFKPVDSFIYGFT